MSEEEFGPARGGRGGARGRAPDPLYARVDVRRRRRPRVIELELIEPALYLDTAPEARRRSPDGSSPRPPEAQRSATSNVWRRFRSGRARPQHRVGQPDAGRLRHRDRVEADPLALRHPVQVDGQIDVDEHEALVVERRDLRCRSRPPSGPLQRRRLLAGDQRMAHPHPADAGAGLDERAGGEPVLHRSVVADGRGRSGRTRRPARARRAAAGVRAPRGSRPAGDRDLGAAAARRGPAPAVGRLASVSIASTRSTRRPGARPPRRPRSGRSGPAAGSRT